MEVRTSRFGTLEVSDESVITMPRGMYGFEQYTRFVLVDYNHDANMWWVQCVDEPELAFVVADPAKLFADYEFVIPNADAQKLHLTKAEDAFVMVVLTVAPGGKKVTANLAAPLILNQKEMLAMQVILQDNRYPVKYPLLQASQKTNKKDKGLVKAA